MAPVDLNQCFLNAVRLMSAEHVEIGSGVVSYQSQRGSFEAQRQARRWWLAGTVLMAAAPLKFAVAALLNPAPIDPALAERVQSAILVPPEWLTQIVGPIDQALRTSGLSVLPALVVLFFLLRMWFGYGRRLFKPQPAGRT
jgi:hypothetical protein